MSSASIPRLQVLGTALLFATGGAAIKSSQLSSLQVACFRSGIAALALALMSRHARRFSPRVLLVAVAYAATMVLYVLANKATTAANATFLQATAPLYVLLLGPWLLKEPIRRADFAFLGALAVGLGLLLIGRTDAVASAPDPVLGNTLGAMNGVVWALTLIGLRWLGTEQAARGGGGSPLAAACAGNLLAFVVCLPFALPVGPVAPLDVGVVVWLGVFQIAIAYVILGFGVRRLTAFEVAVLLMLEPALSPLLAWAVHGERPGALAIVGGAFVVGASLVKTRREMRLQPGRASLPR